MKSSFRFLLSGLAAIAFVTAWAAAPIPGPKGGRIVTATAPHVEFLVAPDRAVVVTFYDAELRPVAPAGQVVTAVAEAPAGRVDLAFAAKDGALVSSAPLPEGEGYRIVLQVRDAAAARPKNYRIDFHDEICGECRRAEYACVCDGHGGESGH